MSRKAVRVRSSALFFTCKYCKKVECPARSTGGLAAVDLIPWPRPYRRRRVFPCWVSSASSGKQSWLCWRAEAGIGLASAGYHKNQEDRAVCLRSCQRTLGEVTAQGL